jgi:hypothetical protein
MLIYFEKTSIATLYQPQESKPSQLMLTPKSNLIFNNIRRNAAPFFIPVKQQCRVSARHCLNSD